MTHEDTFISCKNSPVHWQHYAHVKAQTKDLEVTETDSQVKHSLGCALPGFQDIAPKKSVLQLLSCSQTILCLCFHKEAVPHIKFHFNYTDEMRRVPFASCTLLH